MQIYVKISIAKAPSIPFMGTGPLRLLEKIRKHKSINKAAKSMNLSYVKALKMLNRLEECLDKRMLVRTRGGSKRGGAQLTPYAEKYIDHYVELQENIASFATKELQKFEEKLEKED